MRNCFTLLFFILLCVTARAQHAPLYSQYMFNGIVINPAYTGSREMLSAALLHRSQWSAIEGAPQTQTFSMHTPLKKNKVALGLMVFHDKIGITRRQGASLTYAYRIKLKKGKLAFGVSAGIEGEQSRWSSVTRVDMNDQVFLNDSPVHWSPGAGAGLYYYTDKFYLGTSVPSLLSASAAGSGMTVKAVPSGMNYMLTSGMIIPMGQVKLKPSLLLRYHSASGVQADVNANVFISDIIEIGGSYRAGSAVVGMLGYSINDQFKVGYAYDHTLSTLGSFARGTHEFMLRYELVHKVKASSPRYF